MFDPGSPALDVGIFDGSIWIKGCCFQVLIITDAKGCPVDDVKYAKPGIKLPGFHIIEGGDKIIPYPAHGVP